MISTSVGKYKYQVGKNPSCSLYHHTLDYLAAAALERNCTIISFMMRVNRSILQSMYGAKLEYKHSGSAVWMLSALPRHFSAVLISHQTWSYTCNWVWGQSCSVLALLIFYPERMSHFVLIYSRRREQQWAQNIIPHWRERSGKEVLHPWQQLCNFK